MSKYNQTALITGASSGIGECIANEFASRGYCLILVARNKKKLNQLAKQLEQEYQVDAQVFSADLSKANTAYELADAVNTAGLEVDILVNNAGAMSFTDFDKTDPDELASLINLNVNGCASMCRAFLPPMLERKSGKIMNISSISAFWPVPKISTYAASKSFVLHLTEALSEEFKDQGVNFTAVCPSFTATPMVDGAKDKQSGMVIPDFAIGDPEDVARDAVDACLSNKVVLVPGLQNRLMVNASRTQPKWLLRSTVGFFTRMFS